MSLFSLWGWLGTGLCPIPHSLIAPEFPVACLPASYSCSGSLTFLKIDLLGSASGPKGFGFDYIYIYFFFLLGGFWDVN